jgi:DNA-directed RNA polymerase subunit L
LEKNEVAVVSRQHPASHFVCHRGIPLTVPPPFSLFSRLKIKLKDRHFDTTEVIKAESQAALNDLQDAFKRMAETEGNYQ